MRNGEIRRKIQARVGRDGGDGGGGPWHAVAAKRLYTRSPDAPMAATSSTAALNKGGSHRGQIQQMHILIPHFPLSSPTFIMSITSYTSGRPPPSTKSRPPCTFHGRNREAVANAETVEDDGIPKLARVDVYP